MRNIRIAILDSGFPQADNRYKNSVCGYVVSNENGNYIVKKEEVLDTIGHATAVFGIFDKNLEGVHFDIYKVFSDDLETEEKCFLEALKFIARNNNTDLLHISAGIVHPSLYWELLEICRTINNQGTIIVSSFDNNGGISFPAAFPFVIGVDLSPNKLKINEFEYVEGDVINIRASASYHRVNWIKPKTILTQGSSYSSVFVSVKIVELLLKDIKSVETIKEELKKLSHGVYFETKVKKRKPFQINKAILFPFNKEMHSIARFYDILPFSIHSFTDTKYSMNIGKSTRQIFQNTFCDYFIKDIDSVNWDDDFDTVIMGHVGELSSLSKVDYSSYIVTQCKKYNKKIYSFEKLDNDDGLQIFYPELSSDMVPSNRFGKIRNIPVPVLGIFGTSSRQGKFTTQIILKKMLQDEGYKVGHLATEPQGYLLNADDVIPIGYHSKTEISDNDLVAIINESLWDIFSKKIDIIIVGSQSGTIPFSYDNLEYYPFLQYPFLLGTIPDRVILCVNPHDDYCYITRTINYIESVIETKIIALAVFPILQQTMGTSFTLKKRILTEAEMNRVTKILEIKTGIPAYSMGTESDMKCLCARVIDCFS